MAQKHLKKTALYLIPNTPKENNMLQQLMITFMDFASLIPRQSLYVVEGLCIITT